MVNNNDTGQYNKFIENLDLSKDCYNTETKQFNTLKLMMYGLDYKYLSMSVIYAIIIAYILDFKQSFYVLYPLLWLCSIAGTVILIFKSVLYFTRSAFFSIRSRRAEPTLPKPAILILIFFIFYFVFH